MVRTETEAVAVLQQRERELYLSLLKDTGNGFFTFSG